jgi:general secretion pathway protein C
VARALGGGRSPAASQSLPIPDASAGRFKLTGVVADKQARGYALIAIDGQPARPFRVGSQVGDALLLQSVSKAGAVLATSPDGPMAVRLEMPKLGPP